MMQRKIPIELEPGVFLLLAALLLLCPLKWVGALLGAAVFHELCHYVAVRICRGEILQIRIGPGGAVIEAGDMGWTGNLFCSLAGPAGGFFIVLLGRYFPRAAICGWCQSMFNLIPLYPLDGGRALQALLEGLLPAEKAKRWLRLTEVSAVILLFLGAFVFTIKTESGFLPLFAVGMLLVKLYRAKSSCKDTRLGVQ